MTQEPCYICTGAIEIRNDEVFNGAKVKPICKKHREMVVDRCSRYNTSIDDAIYQLRVICAEDDDVEVEI